MSILKNSLTKLCTIFKIFCQSDSITKASARIATNDNNDNNACLPTASMAYSIENTRAHVLSNKYLQ